MTSSPPTWRPATVLGRAAACLGVALLAGCSALNHTRDFAENELYYADVPFRTKAPGDRAMFVAPVADVRAATPLPMHENGFPIRYAGDDFWLRPVPEMFGDVLVRQFEESELFPAVATEASADALVAKPELVAFTIGAQEGMAGSQTFAEVGLRLRVFGPAAADGSRPLWHDQVYGNRQVSEYEIKPVSPYRLIGRALQVTVSKVLNGLDGSNVARSGVPIDAIQPLDPAAAPPAEASAPIR